MSKYTVKEQSRCPICHDKVTMKDGKFVEHPKPAWTYAALKLGPDYRCDGSGGELAKRKYEDMQEW